MAMDIVSSLNSKNQNYKLGVGDRNNLEVKDFVRYLKEVGLKDPSAITKLADKIFAEKKRGREYLVIKLSVETNPWSWEIGPYEQSNAEGNAAIG
jgi:hypothetical protein